MLGLGDVVMPGLLLCFVMRYDAYKRAQAARMAESGIPLPSNWLRISYFHCSLFGYFLGLLTATISSEVRTLSLHSGSSAPQVFKAAQPALLYLVPFTLFPLFGMAWLKVHFLIKTIFLDFQLNYCIL
jgi:signal peptide peptidase-like protein 3